MPPPWQSSVPQEYSRGDVSVFNQLIFPQAVKCYKDEGLIKIAVFSQKNKKPNKTNKTPQTLKNKIRRALKKQTKKPQHKQNHKVQNTEKNLKCLCFFFPPHEKGLSSVTIGMKYQYPFGSGKTKVCWNLWYFQSSASSSNQPNVCMFYASWINSKCKLYQ